MEKDPKLKISKPWTPILEKTLINADRRAGKLGFHDWLPVQHRNSGMLCGLWDTIAKGEKEGIFTPGQTILDMGSGSGSSSIIWACRGYNVYGIELHPELVRSSREAINEAKSLIEQNMNIKILEGSYFPQDYITFRESGSAISPRHEIAVLQREKKSEDRTFHPICDDDVYEKHNLNLSTIDIFYAYAWPIQSPSILEIFQKYGRKDSRLLLIGGYEPELLEELGLTHLPDNWDCIYKK